jgi:hypothetical protein
MRITAMQRWEGKSENTTPSAQTLFPLTLRSGILVFANSQPPTLQQRTGIPTGSFRPGIASGGGSVGAAAGTAAQTMSQSIASRKRARLGK